MNCMKHSRSWVRMLRIFYIGYDARRSADSSLNFKLCSCFAPFSIFVYYYCYYWLYSSFFALADAFVFIGIFEWPSGKNCLAQKMDKEVEWMCLCMHRSHVYLFFYVFEWAQNALLHMPTQEHRLMFIAQHYCYYMTSVRVQFVRTHFSPSFSGATFFFYRVIVRLIWKIKIAVTEAH